MDKIDLLIVEDEVDEREVRAQTAERYGLSVITFESGLRALEYLKGLDSSQLPRGYLIDMRTGIDEEELESPAAIFHFLNEKNCTENFRFNTGHFSEHDREVQNLTNAKVILKGDDELYVFLKDLNDSKAS